MDSGTRGAVQGARPQSAPDPTWPAARAQAVYGDDVPEREPEALSLASWVLWYGDLRSAPWTQKKIKEAIALCTPPATWRQLHKEARTFLVEGRRVDRPDETALRSKRVWLHGVLQWTYAASHQWRVWFRNHERRCASGNACPSLKVSSPKIRAKRLRKLCHGYCATCARRRQRRAKRAV